MKSFIDYLIESHQTYVFRLKIAGEVTSEQLDRLENLLDKFGVESMSKPSRTPIQEHPIDFPESVTNTEVNIIDLETSYPATPQVLTAIIGEVTGYPESHIVVLTDDQNDAQEETLDAMEVDPEYEPLLGSDYPTEPPEAAFGEKLIKHAETRKFEFAGKKAPKVKTTNDLPVGTKSPIGSKK